MKLTEKRGFADVLTQTPVEAASVATKAAPVTGAGLGTAEVVSQGALSSGHGAVAGLPDEVGQRVFRSLGIVLAAVVLAFRGLAPVAAS